MRNVMHELLTSKQFVGVYLDNEYKYVILEITPIGENDIHVKVRSENANEEEWRIAYEDTCWIEDTREGKGLSFSTNSGNKFEFLTDMDAPE